MRLRLAGPGEDGDAVARIFLAARAGMTYLPRVHTDEETTRFFRDAVVPNDEVWLAEDDSGTVGFAALGSAELNHLYVRPDAQGRGAGSLLLDRAKERRPDGFRFWVFQQNADARRFYERHGCVLVLETDGAGNEEREPDALYEWRPAAAATATR